MLCTKIELNVKTKQKQQFVYVHNMFCRYSELTIFMNNDNLSSYCGLVDAKIRASDKDLPVCSSSF